MEAPVHPPVVFLATGGTGGHIFPADAVAEALIQQGVHPVFVSDARLQRFTHAMGSVASGKAEVITITAKSPSGNPWKKLVGVASLMVGFVQSLWHIQRYAPVAVVGFGGYPSFPPLLAALVLRTPTLVHDQNAILGRANRWLAKKVSGVALAFPSQAPEAAQGVVCGNPVRPAIQAMAQAGYAPPVADQPFRLLVTGGSLGARVFAGLLPAAIATLPEGLRMRLQIVQQCRAEDMESVRAAYEAVNLKAELAPFFSNMAERIAASHLVVARAGASTVTELMVIGRPAILIPYPHAMDDHQTANARVMADAGGAWLLPEAEAKPEKLAELLAEALHSPHRLADMAKQAHQPEQAESAQNIAKLIMKIAEK